MLERNSPTIRLSSVDLPQPDGQVQEIAKNGSNGPLEFPAAIVFVGGTAYIANYDTPRRDNLDANGKSALDGIGASIAQINP